jgi:hypothetical protein
VALLLLANRCAEGGSTFNPEVIERLLWHLNSGVLPRLTRRRTGKASGDFSLHCELVAVLLGRGRVVDRDGTKSTRRALSAHSLKPLQIRPGECLNLINENSFSLAFAAAAIARAQRLADIVGPYLAAMGPIPHGNGHAWEFTSYTGDERANLLRAVRPLTRDYRGARARASQPAGGFTGVEALRHALRSSTEWLVARINFPNELVPTADVKLATYEMRCRHPVHSMCALRHAIAEIAELLAKSPNMSLRGNRSAAVARDVRKVAAISCYGWSESGHHTHDVSMADASEIYDMIRSIEHMVAGHSATLRRQLGV